MILNMPLNWKKVSQHLQKLSDSSNLEKIISKQMIEIIKEEHPDDYQEYIKNNRKNLDEIQERLKNKYSLEIKQKSEEILHVQDYHY